MYLYSPKNHRWYDEMIKKGYAEKNEEYYSTFYNGNPSNIFINLLLAQGYKNRNILDIGCGPGKYTIKLTDKFDTVIGLDLSRQSINLAKRQRIKPNLTFIIANSKKLPFKDNSFDVVFSRLSPHNLNEMYRVLKSKRLAFCMRVGETDAIKLRDVFDQKKTVSKMNKYIKKSIHYSKHKIDEWKKVGFIKVRSTEYEYDMYFKSLNDLAKYLSRIPIIPEFNINNPNHMLKLNEYVKKSLGFKGGRAMLHRHRYIIQGYKN